MFENLGFVERRRLFILYRMCQAFEEHGSVGTAAGISSNLASVVLNHLKLCQGCQVLLADEEACDEQTLYSGDLRIGPDAQLIKDITDEEREVVDQWQRAHSVKELMGQDHLLNQIDSAEQEFALARGLVRKIALFLDHLNDQLPKDD